MQRLTNLVYVDKTDLSTEGIGHKQVVPAFVGSDTFGGHARYDAETLLLSNSKGIVRVNQTTKAYDILSFATRDDLRVSARLNNDLVIPTSNRMLVYDGTNLLTNPISATTCQTVAIFNNRMVYAGFSDAPHDVLVSDLNNALVADIAGSNPNDGFRITVDPTTQGGLIAMTSVYAKGNNEQYVVLFKRNSIYLLRGSTQATVTVTKIYEGYGTFNSRSVAPVGSDVYFVNEQGFFSLSSTVENGDMLVNVIDTTAVDSTWRELSKYPDRVEISLSPTEREIWVTFPDVRGDPAGVLVYSYDRRVRYGSGDTILPYWTKLIPYAFSGLHAVNSVTYGFDKVGALVQLRVGNTFGDNVPQWSLHIPNLDLDKLERHKQVDHGFVLLKVGTYPNFNVSWNWRQGDGSQSFHQGYMRLDPHSAFISQAARPALELERNTFLAEYGLPTGGVVGKYFYNWCNYGTAYYAEAQTPFIDNEYKKSYFGAASFASYKDNVVQFPLRGMGMGQMLSLTLDGQGHPVHPPRIAGVTLQVYFGSNKGNKA